MSMGPSSFLWNAGFPTVQQLVLPFNITGAKASSPVPLTNSAVYNFYDAIASQSTIDTFLGTSSEFTTTQFDSTTMGNDAFGVLINMGSVGGISGVTNNQGQASSVLFMEASCYSGTGGSTAVTRVVQASATLPNSTLGTAVAVGAYGNIGLTVDFGNTPDFDGLSSGTIVIKLYWQSL
jgi:hypothetical protein